MNKLANFNDFNDNLNQEFDGKINYELINSELIIEMHLLNPFEFSTMFNEINLHTYIFNDFND